MLKPPTSVHKSHYQTVLSNTDKQYSHQLREGNPWLVLRTLAKWRQGAHTYRFAGLSDLARLAGRGGQRPR